MMKSVVRFQRIKSDYQVLDIFLEFKVHLIFVVDEQQGSNSIGIFRYANQFLQKPLWFSELFKLSFEGFDIHLLLLGWQYLD